MSSLRTAAAYPMTTFATPGLGPTRILRQIGKDSEFPGCYVLWERDCPFYVGISRKVVARLMQHVRGTTHFDASLAYRMACNGEKHGMRREQAMTDQAFREKFEAAKAQIMGMSVRFVRIDNALERYLFEVYASMDLKTHRYNTFETH